jgi:hypothetical protein
MGDRCFADRDTFFPIFTRSTISMRHNALIGGAMPTLSGRDVFAATRGIEEVAGFEVEEWGAYPGRT